MLEYYNWQTLQRHDADHLEDEAAQSRHRSPQSASATTACSSGAQDEGAELPVQGPRACGATGYGAGDFARRSATTPTGVRAARARAGFRLEALKPEGQAIEKALPRRRAEADGTYPFAPTSSPASGLWLLKLVLDRSQSDDPEKFRAAVLSLDLPVGSMINGWA